MRPVTRPVPVGLPEAQEAARLVARACGVQEGLGVRILPERADAAADYFNGMISLYGNPNLQTVLHEAAHHVHEMRLGRAPKRAHDVGFHRICFEIRDHFRALSGMDLVGINKYEKTEAYSKALGEWFSKRVA